MITAAVIRLRTVDLPAHTVLELLRRTAHETLPAFTLERRIVWMIRWRDPETAARARVTQPGVLHNPNKESLTTISDPHASLVPAGPGDAVVVVWSRDRVGLLELSSAVGDTNGGIENAEHVTIWWLRASHTDAAPGALRAFAEEVATVRDRRHGLLIHPHMAAGVVVSGAPTVDAIAQAVWPGKEDVEAMTR